VGVDPERARLAVVENEFASVTISLDTAGHNPRHVCLGASLARMEARVLFGELLRTFPDFQVTRARRPRPVDARRDGVRTAGRVRVPRAGPCRGVTRRSPGGGGLPSFRRGC
jgi:cytochrome P450